MKRLALAPAARRDLRDIATFIGEDNPVRARSFVAELRSKAEQASERPLSFRARPDIGPDIRSIPHGKYLILFRDLPDKVVVLRFFHSAQDLRALRFD